MSSKLVQLTVQGRPGCTSRLIPCPFILVPYCIAPSTHVLPTLGPKVCEEDLLWARWRCRVIVVGSPAQDRAPQKGRWYDLQVESRVWTSISGLISFCGWPGRGSKYGLLSCIVYAHGASGLPNERAMLRAHGLRKWPRTADIWPRTADMGLAWKKIQRMNRNEP